VRKQHIEFVAIQPTTIRFDRPDAFALRLDQKWPWLQRVCIAILRKLGAYDIGETVKIERSTIDAPTFMERLFKQQSNITQFFNVRPTRLLIGSEDYAELMREAVTTGQFNFRAEYGIGREICGLKVEVVPWMRGVLVLP
jgi:hypothetical protein